MAGIPLTPEAITADWLATRLPNADDSLTIRNVERIGADRGFTGCVARLTLADQGSAVPPTVIVKMPDPEIADTMPDGWFDRFVTEARFYDDLAMTIGVAVPDGHFSEWDDAAHRFVLCLDDVAGEPGDAAAGCSRERREAVVRAIACVHAHGWNRTTSLAPWLQPRDTDPDAFVERYRERMPVFVERWGHLLEAGDRALLERLVDDLPRVLTACADRTRTIIHGDLHLDNVIFTPDDRPVIIDWQSAALGPHGFDLALLGTDPQPDVTDGREHMEWLVTAWHDDLCSHGNVERYSIDDAMLDARLGLLRLTAGVACGFSNLDRETIDGRQLELLEAWFRDGTLFETIRDWRDESG